MNKKRQLQLKYFGDPILTKKAVEIKAITDEIKQIADEMFLIMYEKNGIGLAGPQVGIDLKIITVDLKLNYPNNFLEGSQGEAFLLPQMPFALINPEISFYSQEIKIIEEGCLSIPEIYAPVERSETIIIKAQMLSGEKIHLKCAGFLAIVLQHEVDHLNGKLYIDRLNEKCYKKILTKLDKLKNQISK